MFRFKIILPILFLAGLQSWAQTTEGQQPRTVNMKTFAVSYLNWTEAMNIELNGATAKDWSNFYGIEVTLEKESYVRRWGSEYSGSLILGQANGGGSQTAIAYQANYRDWMGAEATYRLGYRISPQISMSVGALALFRSVSWPDDPATGAKATSGSQTNFGLIGTVSYRLNREFELRQTLGTFASKATTLWSVGLGYKF